MRAKLFDIPALYRALFENVRFASISNSLSLLGVLIRRNFMFLFIKLRSVLCYLNRIWKMC